MAQQDDYYYEIQLTNKQLVFYFMAAAMGLILSFLAGVMVGRGVDNSTQAAEAQAAAKPLHDERVVPEEASPKPSATPAEELTYAQRLESEKPDDSMPKAAKADGARPPRPSPSAGKAADKPAATKSPAAERPSPAASPASRPSAAAAKASPKPSAAPAVGKPVAGTFTIQVGAFKDKEAAEGVVARLKKKGYSAFVVAPDGSDALFNVRVGSYPARTDAERIQTKLRDEERFKPFIVKN